MKEFHNAVFSVDCHNIDDGLIDKAIHIAQNLGCRLTIVDSIRDLSWLSRMSLPDPAGVTELIEKEKQADMQKVVERFQQAGVEATGEILHGKTSVAILEFCAAGQVDLIIRVTKGVHSKEQGRLGRTSTQLLRHSKCAIWLIHQQTKPVSENVIACIDTETEGTEDFELADLILETAEFIHRTGKGTLSLVHAWELWNKKMVKSRISEEEYEQWKLDCRQAESDRFNTFLERHNRSVDDDDAFLLEGDPSDSIPEFASNVNADVVVMGTVGRSGFTGFLIGNTAERIFERVDCDVLALKHQINIPS